MLAAPLAQPRTQTAGDARSLARPGRARAMPERERESPPAEMRSTTWDLGRGAIFPHDLPPRALPHPLQAKLVVGPVDDPWEREADRVAERVMRMPPPAPAAAALAPLRLSRKCAGCEEEERLQRQSIERPAPAIGEAPRIVHDVLRMPGRPLDATSRAYFEPRFGHDFSTVRVHADANAAANSAKAVGARAYTVGHDIVFGAGEQAHDRALLAHELAHVVQQSAAPSALRRFPMCRQLLDPPEGPYVSENSVRDSLARDARRLGRVERELEIPGGSAAVLRTEPAPRRGGDVITPQVLSAISDVEGRADIAVLNGTALEVIEVKRATWGDAEFAEKQLLNYVSKGNRAIREVERIWRARGHSRDTVTSVRGMPTARLSLLPNPRQISSTVGSAGLVPQWRHHVQGRRTGRRRNCPLRRERPGPP